MAPRNGRLLEIFTRPYGSSGTTHLSDAVVNHCRQDPPRSGTNWCPKLQHNLKGAARSAESEVRTIVQNWAKAISEGDRGVILALHSSDRLMFDFPGTVKGLDAYDKTWHFSSQIRLTRSASYRARSQ